MSLLQEVQQTTPLETLSSKRVLCIPLHSIQCWGVLIVAGSLNSSRTLEDIFGKEHFSHVKSATWQKGHLGQSVSTNFYTNHHVNNYCTLSRYHNRG